MLWRSFLDFCSTGAAAGTISFNEYCFRFGRRYQIEHNRRVRERRFGLGASMASGLSVLCSAPTLLGSHRVDPTQGSTSNKQTSNESEKLQKDIFVGERCFCLADCGTKLWSQSFVVGRTPRCVKSRDHMGSVSPGCMKRFFYRTSFWSMRLLPKWLPTFILKLLKLFVTPKLICCSGERGTGERKRGYQAGFSEQVIDLLVLKLNNFNSYIHFGNILQFDLYIQSHSIILLLAKYVRSKSIVIYIYHIYFNLLLTFVELEVASQSVQWNKPSRRQERERLMLEREREALRRERKDLERERKAETWGYELLRGIAGA